jgi:uncharacterized protein (TIGR00369 family)
MNRWTPAAFAELTRKTTPLAELFDFRTEMLGEGTARMRVPFRPEFTRDGGTVSGPVLMALADYAMYGAVMTVVPEGDKAVTSSLNCNFLHRPAARDVIAEAELIRCGKRLAYGEVMLYSEGDPAEPVAHVTATYSIPPQSQPPKWVRRAR